MQQFPVIEEASSKEEVSCLKWTKFHHSRKVCVNFKIETYKLKIGTCSDRNTFFFKQTAIEVKLSE